MIEENNEFIPEEEIGEDEDYVKATDERENAIEWYCKKDQVTCTFSQRKFVNRILKLAKENPEDVIILKINEDGTVLAHMPLSYLPLPRKPIERELTEEQRESYRKRFEQYRKTKRKNTDLEKE